MSTLYKMFVGVLAERLKEELKEKGGIIENLERYLERKISLKCGKGNEV